MAQRKVKGIIMHMFGISAEAVYVVQAIWKTKYRRTKNKVVKLDVTVLGQE